MSLIEYTIDGSINKIEKAIDRLRAFEPSEGYYLAFSGGKDSIVIESIARDAGVKFDAHYNVTGIDPPELVYFIREKYPSVKFEMYKKSMFKLIEKKGLPTRLSRFCCEHLKERGGEGRICVTGVRWAESNKRKNNRKEFEVLTSKIKDKILFSDNEEDRRLFENCTVKGKRIVNPIIDWTDEEVWEYIHLKKLDYCKLYDEGFKRLGCIGCPLSRKSMMMELERWPKFHENYRRAVARFLPEYLKRRELKGEKPRFTTVDEMMDWWLEREGVKNQDANQIELEVSHEK